MNIKMFYDKDLTVCRFGSYKDKNGTYFVECEYTPSKNDWAFFKCYENDTVDATDADVSPEMQLYIQRLVLNATGQKVHLRSQKEVRMLGTKLGDKNEVLYAIDNDWLEQNFKNFSEGNVDECEQVIARAMLEKSVAFIYQTNAGHPFIFTETNSSEKGYVAFADVISQILRMTGHEDAATVVDRLLDIQPA